MANLHPIGRPKRSKENFEEPRSVELAVLKALPCVVYEADESFRVTLISPNTAELLGIESPILFNTRWLCSDRVAMPDRQLLQIQLAKLQDYPSICLNHRLIDDHGSLITVAHSIRSRADGCRKYFHGCLTPIAPGISHRETIDIEIVSKFIHKIGNHFQLLNLMFDSIRRNGASAKNLDALQQTTETAIGLTRGFANLLQISSATDLIDLAELVESTIEMHSHVASEKDVLVEFRKTEVKGKINIWGDTILLEMALAAVIANAIEASPQGSTVRIDLCSRAETMSRFGLNMAAVRVIDYGSGMSEDQLSQGSQPFYTTRPGHEGMGLSLASRFVELHGGFVHLTSVQGAGTEVDIILPLAEPSGRPGGDVALK
jgi:hypothetical protein